MNKKKIVISVLLCLIAALVAAGLFFGLSGGAGVEHKDVTEWETLVNSEFDNMAPKGVLASEYIAEVNSIKVNNVTYGDEKNAVLDCTVDTIDVYGTIKPHYNEFMSAKAKKRTGMQKTELDFQMEFEDKIIALLENAEKQSENIKVEFYQTGDGLKIYSTEDIVNIVYGGALNIDGEVKGITEYEDASGGKHEVESTNIAKGLSNCFAVKFDSEKPDTSTYFGRAWNNLKKDFSKNFIEHDRWKTILQGLWVTIKLTILALLIGIVLGFIVAFVRCTRLKSAKPGSILKFFDGICQIYLTVIRGTPVVVQIMIIYFVIFMPIGVDKFIAAVICFGLNSGAYVAEIVRGGIMSVDVGQTEAGRSLGFNYMQTMFYIVFPQAFKAVLPALANEFVVLLKETSIAFYIGIGDLMYSGNAIRAATYSAFMPLVAVAIIYLIMVIGLSKLVSLLERRLRNSER